jgi:SAM-dependent methyltransferase
VLTVDFDRLGLAAGELLLDVGCGAGRHSVEALRRGARAISLDRDAGEVRRAVAAGPAAEALLGEPLDGGATQPVCADAYSLPFADATFDVVVASEVLEHLVDDRQAIAELVRVLRPGGRLAVTVPRALPERVCWTLSRDYHETPGGHVRIYRGHELRAALGVAGLRVLDWHHAHGLHSAYWWLRCAVGVERDDHLAVRLYHRLLVWDLMARPWPTRLAERVLDPVVGKSLVVYCERPGAMAAPARALEPIDWGASPPDDLPSGQARRPRPPRAGSRPRSVTAPSSKIDGAAAA